MQLFLAAAAGGALGAGARFLVNLACVQLLGPGFPWATLTVNVTGSFLMGLLVGFSGNLLEGSALVRTFLATGILGGFTTFSAFSLDALQLFERRQPLLAILYISASVVISIAALWAGLAAAKVSIR
jgi:fluoride exporter